MVEVLVAMTADMEAAAAVLAAVGAAAP